MPNGTEKPDATPQPEPSKAGRLHAIATPAAAREAAEQALSAELGGRSFLLGPAMTSSWPPTAGQLMFIAYPLEPSPHQMEVYQVGQPHAVTIDLTFGTVTSTALPASEALVALEQTRQPLHVRQALEQAEQGLINVLIGARTLEKSFGLLRGYRTWLERHQDIAADLQHRYPDTLAWMLDPRAEADGFQVATTD